MSAARVVVGGDPSAEETAAVVAALSAYLTSGAAEGDGRPAAYRSRWRIAALQQAAERAPLLYSDSAAARKANS